METNVNLNEQSAGKKDWGGYNLLVILLLQVVVEKPHVSHPLRRRDEMEVVAQTHDLLIVRYHLSVGLEAPANSTAFCLTQAWHNTSPKHGINAKTAWEILFSSTHYQTSY